MANQSTTDHVGIADLVQAARAYLIRSDLICLDRESVQAAHRLGCLLDRLADGADIVPFTHKAG